MCMNTLMILENEIQNNAVLLERSLLKEIKLKFCPPLFFYDNLPLKFILQTSRVVKNSFLVRFFLQLL